MAGYIKSHSNYRLQTRHQVTNNGIIYERDISTVGGVNSFATGQATVYQSGNFVIVVNNGPSASRHIRNKQWLASGNNSDTWDETPSPEFIEKARKQIDKLKRRSIPSLPPPNLLNSSGAHSAATSDSEKVEKPMNKFTIQYTNRQDL